MIDYENLRTFNLTMGETPGYLALPVVPSVEMMLAAASRPNVFREGDTLADYVVGWDFESDGVPPEMPGELVATYGLQKAFVLGVLADGWAGCMDGFREWFIRRGRDGSTPFVNSWLKALPVCCPSGGWPENKEQATEKHTSHARLPETIPSSPWITPSSGLNMDSILLAPARCTGIMALRARQKDSTTRLFVSLEELISDRDLPYIPGYSSEHRLDSDDRTSLLFSAMWDAAVSQLMTGEQHTIFPSCAQAHAALLVAALAQRSRCRDEWGSSFYYAAPYSEISITTDSGGLKASVSDNGVDWTYEDKEEGSLLSRRSADARFPKEAELLGSALDRLDRLKPISHTTRPLIHQQVPGGEAI